MPHRRHFPATPPAGTVHAVTGDPIEEITARELARRLREPEPPALIDVREPWEHHLARIAGARLVPLAQLPAALDSFEAAREYVILCHHGVRSLMAARLLDAHGVRRVASLAGGIDAWSEEVDPTVPQY